jgi:hypothetical protein
MIIIIIGWRAMYGTWPSFSDYKTTNLFGLSCQHYAKSSAILENRRFSVKVFSLGC